MDKTTATWDNNNAVLNVECPYCAQVFDILKEHPDFYNDFLIEPGEYGTDASTDMEIECPHCWDTFLTDLETL